MMEHEHNNKYNLRFRICGNKMSRAKISDDVYYECLSITYKRPELLFFLENSYFLKVTSSNFDAHM
jgi:hypothetical protein